jgi:hypothetical protein
VEHFQNIDIMQPGAFARLGLAALAWVLDRDLWIWVCASGAAANALCLAFGRRGRLDHLTSAGLWAIAALLFALREPAMRWLEKPTFESVPWPVWVVLVAGQWLFGVVVIIGAVASLFGWSAGRRVKNVEKGGYWSGRHRRQVVRTPFKSRVPRSTPSLR